jgi:uncharacterized spore protein YtfJ
VDDLLKSIAGPLQASAAAKNIFGDPVEAHGRTVIPVARVAYGFGGGSGRGSRDGHNGEGGGGGGGVLAMPVGAIEITSSGTRFVPLRTPRQSIGAILLGIGLGWLIASRLLPHTGKRT